MIRKAFPQALREDARMHSGMLSERAGRSKTDFHKLRIRVKILYVEDTGPAGPVT